MQHSEKSRKYNTVETSGMKKMSRREPKSLRKGHKTQQNSLELLQFYSKLEIFYLFVVVFYI